MQRPLTLFERQFPLFVCSQLISQWGGQGFVGVDLTIGVVKVFHDPKNPICVFVEPIETDLVCHPKENKNAAHEAHDKARHIDKRVNLLAKNIAGGNE
ncbi:MAG: hypothetical protein IPJ20_08835 [Flammeovirgaceae bacterium]|nr:hypothetical protein [Flammeovirgaceae bacterium]